MEAQLKKIRVLIVDDSFFMRKVISDFLRSDPEIEVVGEASDGVEALKRIAELNPQVVTLDIEMPNMGGLETLQRIVEDRPHPSVIMVSGYVHEEADITLQCLEIGAADFILKPSGSFSLDIDKIKGRLIEKVKNAPKIDTSKIRTSSPMPPRMGHLHKTGGIVVIGASTGGPTALEILLPTFPHNFPYSVVVAQHLPKAFIEPFASRLNKHCQLPVTTALHNMKVATDTIYIASGGTNTSIHQRNGRPFFEVQDNASSLETPSINVLMESAAAVYRDRTIGIILTGMGKDGADGMVQIKHAGGHTIVQDKSTSAIFGMPGEVVARGVADTVVPLDQIIKEVSGLLG